MTKAFPTAFLILAAMIAAALLAEAFRPRIQLAASAQTMRLEHAIPTTFGDWEVDQDLVPVAPSPEIEQRLDRYYQQTLSRTYRNKVSGQRIMLSIAYGVAQNRELQVHRPEVCYASQGFSISNLKKISLDVPGFGSIPAMRLLGTQGSRSEPVTYWIRFGHDVVRGNLEQGFSRLRHGLAGEIPDALLFRVSAIGVDLDQTYRIEDGFIGDLLTGIDQDTRRFVVGKS